MAHHMTLLLWVPLFLFIPASANAPTPFCPATVCGGVKITYPFWVSSPAATNATSFCGYRDLNVTCDSRLASKPTLHTKLGDFTVLDFDGSTRTFTLLDPDATTGDACPHVRRNFTIQQAGIKLLEYGPEVVNLTFFYNCSGERQDLLKDYRIQCSRLNGDGKSSSSYVFPEMAVNPAHADMYNHCVGPVVTPVMRSAVVMKNISGTFQDALRRGFQLRCMDSGIDDCETCEMNKGYCGGSNWRALDGGLICVCENGLPDPGGGNCSRTDGQGKQSKQIKWIVGSAAGAAGGVMVLVIVAVLCWRHFKPTKRSASLSKLIRSTSTESYSMENDAEALSQTHIFSYKELEEATEGFADMNELGDGGFGTVYKGKLRDGRVVAIKRLYENNFKREGQFLNEVAILNRLRHKNLVSLYGCTSRHSRGLLLVYEYVPNGTVADHLHGPRAESGALTWHVRMNIALETAGALAYLHAVEPQIIHRDVKTNNILLDENYHVKVADFGLSRLFPPDATHVSTVPQGTPGYLDPEYHQCYQLTDKSDVYSFGVVLAELISSKPAVDITRKRNEINLANMAISKIQNCQLKELVDPLLGYDSDDTVRSMIDQVAELAFRCLQPEKEMRPSMEEILEVLKGITGVAGGTRKEHNHLGGKVDQDRRKLTDDCASLLNGSVQYSPNTVHADWVSRTTTPNASS